MKIRIAVIIICITLMLIVTSVIDSFNHSETDRPEKADVIIMLGGGDKGRMEKAAELYHEGYADYVIITPESEDIYPQSTEFARELGIPEDAIIEEYEATSTYTNAVESFKIMDEYGFDSALVVTSDYHLKRSKLIYDRVSDGQYDLKYIAALGAGGEKWNERSYADRIWFNEFYKLWGYRLGLYNFIDVPDEK
ncbi:YdcF family protein [Jeotgalicoccus nanhaiensis]|uniref:YdcF family protein n=1 Tax=Jeotgalicoccus nanhaiensis TaxID=568603 RepID=A0ABR9XXN0_9STAP|nr:YdcF family protein [Jeotgalicoccus nanhaiensis]MBF0753486.1 YdcF family protein [Jeotgalicoccus nanhaiensis]TFU62642.1 YdcF family protein [Jeotgalicoccus nanhaiensis]